MGVFSLWIIHYGMFATDAWAIRLVGSSWQIGRAWDNKWTLQRTTKTQVEAEDYVRASAKADGNLAVRCTGSLETLLRTLALEQEWKTIT